MTVLRGKAGPSVSKPIVEENLRITDGLLPININVVMCTHDTAGFRWGTVFGRAFRRHHEHFSGERLMGNRLGAAARVGPFRYLKGENEYYLDDRKVEAGLAVELQLADGTWLSCMFGEKYEDNLPQLRLPIMGDTEPGAEIDIFITEAVLRWPKKVEVNAE